MKNYHVCVGLCVCVMREGAQREAEGSKEEGNQSNSLQFCVWGEKGLFHQLVATLPKKKKSVCVCYVCMSQGVLS